MPFQSRAMITPLFVGHRAVLFGGHVQYDYNTIEESTQLAAGQWLVCRRNLDWTDHGTKPSKDLETTPT